MNLMNFDIDIYIRPKSTFIDKEFDGISTYIGRQSDGTIKIHRKNNKADYYIILNDYDFIQRIENNSYVKV